MKLSKIFLGILVTSIFASCQKDISSENSGTPVSNKVKTYTEDVTSGGTHSVTTFNVAYDASDRVVSITSAASPGDRFVFQYSNGSYTGDIFNANVLSIHEDYFLNSNSLLDSTFQYNDTNDSSTEKYLYNGAKQLVTLKEYDYSLVTGSELFNTTSYVYDGSGNAVTVTDNSSITTYTYYPDLVNNLVLGTPYVPVNKNLVKTTTVVSGGTTVVLNHTYTFDASNRLSTEKIVADSGEMFIKTYTYY
jgi:hypothetical protein